MGDVDDENPDDGPGLISLDMKQFGSGTLSDPLRHAVGMRTAQDQYKMQMWNSFPSLFQNTIFHGEQDQQIKLLRHSGTMAERLSRARELKDDGNAALKAASALSSVGNIAPEPQTSQAEEALCAEMCRVEGCIAAKEQELKNLRQELRALKARHEEERSANNSISPNLLGPYTETAQAKGLESAITSYEKAAGLLRYVECVRPDWKNDDGSYKGIEGESPEAEEARELVASCCLNYALASQKLHKFDQMRQACDEVLAKVNPKSVKALYRRAQALVAPLGALDADRDAAIRDLYAAAQLAPQDKDVRALLTKLRSEKRRQESDDRNTFAGMFDRGEVVTNDPREEGEPPKPIDWDLRDPRVQNLLDIRPGPDDYT